MSNYKSTPIIFDYIWRPLVYIPVNQQAFLVHPGTTIKPQPLPAGWHWHWPILTSIRSISSEVQKFDFNQSSTKATQYTDESIMAVSRDHHLFACQGHALININPQGSAEILARFNRHSIKRVIRPLIRQSIRQAMALLDAQNLTTDLLAAEMLRQAKPLFAPHGLIIHSVKLDQVEYFQPQLMQKPR